MPRYWIELERTQYFTALVEAPNEEAARWLRPGYTPSGVTLLAIEEDDTEGWKVHVDEVLDVPTQEVEP